MQQAPPRQALQVGNGHAIRAGGSCVSYKCSSSVLEHFAELRGGKVLAAGSHRPLRALHQIALHNLLNDLQAPRNGQRRAAQAGQLVQGLRETRCVEASWVQAERAGTKQAGTAG